MSLSRPALLCVVTLCVIGLDSRSARAQENPAATGQQGALNEVVVSARRRNESLQDVPISIVSKSGEDLERANVTSVTELSRLVPGFVFNEFEAGQQSTAQLRGLSSFAFQTHAPQSVGVLIDDVVLDVIGQSVTEFNDIDRIEVLRGPQGTLFGRNTTGGVVHIVTNQPTRELEGKVSAGYGSYNKMKVSGTLNVPFGDTLAARGSVFYADRDGYLRNIADGRMLNKEDQLGLNLKLLYEPHEGTRLRFSGTYVERKRDGASSGGGDPVVGFGPFASEEDIDVNGAIAGPHNSKINGVGSHNYDEKVQAASLIWEQELGSFALTSISSYRTWDFEFGEDADFRTFNSPVEPLFWKRFYVPNDLEGWSQELRLASPSGGRFEYVVGAFLSATDLFERRHFLGNISSDPDPAAAIYVFDLGDQDTEHRDYALFGETDFHLTDAFTLTAGARWTRDTTHVSLDAEPAPFLDPDLGIGIGPLGEVYIPFLESEFPGLRKLSVSQSEWTWRAGLRWEPTRQQMFYATASRGFKGPTITALGVLGRIEPEIVQSYEVGSKLGFLNNRVSTSLALFHADVDDMQVQGVDSIATPRGSVTSIFLTNAAKARSRGVEFEMTAVPTDALTIDVALAYIDAKFLDYTTAGCYASQTPEEGCAAGEVSRQVLSGRRMPLVPKWSGSAAGNYEFALPFWSLRNFLRLDYTYRDRVNWDEALAPLTESDAVGIWGFTLGFRTADDRVELQAYVKNLTDEFVVNDLDGGNETIRANLLPEYQRTWGVTVNYKFH